MKNDLDRVLTHIGKAYERVISKNGRHYLEVRIGAHARQMGRFETEKRFEGAYAVIPLKHPMAGMKVRIDGRTFVDYHQFDSGVVVPGYVAKESGLSHVPFVPENSLVLNFA